MRTLVQKNIAPHIGSPELVALKDEVAQSLNTLFSLPPLSPMKGMISSHHQQPVYFHRDNRLVLLGNCPKLVHCAETFCRGADASSQTTALWT